MNKLIYTFIALVFALSVFSFRTSLVSAAAATKIDLMQDRSAGGSETLDMDGPTGFGFVNFNQNGQDDLRLLVSLKNAEPNTTYEGMFLVCGPTHDDACGFVDIGSLTTDDDGNGSANMWLDVETLQASPFGPGSRTDHFDLIGPAGDVYAASGIDYTVPAP